jgi:hypothetical protein
MIMPDSDNTVALRPRPAASEAASEAGSHRDSDGASHRD